MASNAEIEAGIKEILWQHGKETANADAGPSKGQKNRKERPNSGQRRQKNADRIPPDSKLADSREGKYESDRQGGKQSRPKQLRQHDQIENSHGGTDQKHPPNKNRSYQQKKTDGNSSTDHVDGEDAKGRDPKKRVRRQKSRPEEGQEGKKYDRQGSGGKRNNPEADGKDDGNAGASSATKKKKRKKKKKAGKGEEEKEQRTKTMTSGQKEDNTANYTEKKPTVGQELPSPLFHTSPDVLKELSAEYIYPLRKRSLKFPSAKFFCRLCEYHCDTEIVCRKHMKDSRHARLRTIKTTDILLRSLPPPNDMHHAALDKLVERIYVQNALSEKELTMRQQVADRVAELVKEQFPAEANVKLSVYGTTATQFALKDSDLNLDLTADDSAKVLANLHLVLKDDQSGYFSEVKSDFGAKVPSVLFKITESGLKCQLGVNSGSASQTTRLLTAYSNIDPRVKKLAVVFRYWARLCKVDCQDAGTLPPYAFAIMAVYFLQQCNPPVLPVFEELSNTEAKSSESTFFENLENLGKAWKTKNTWSLGRLWVSLLKFYAVSLDISSMVICIRQHRPLTRDEKKWASKKLAIEDPFARKRNIARSVSHSHVFEYIYDRLRVAYLYYGVPQTQDGPLLDKVDTSKLERQLQENLQKLNESPTTPVRSLPGDKQKDSTPNRDVDKVSQSDMVKNLLKSPVGDGVNMLVSQQLDGGKELPKVRSLDELEKEMLQEDSSAQPTEPGTTKPDTTQPDSGENKQSATRAFANSFVEDVLTDALAELALSGSAAPDRSDESVRDDTAAAEEEECDVMVELSESEPDEGVVVSSDEEGLEEPTTATLEDEDAEEELEVTKDAKDTREESDDEEGSEEDSDTYEDAKEDVEDEEKRNEEADKGNQEPSDKSKSSHIQYDQEILGKLNVDDLVFRFDESTLSDGKGPAIMCSICQQEGHLKQNCPEERLPDLEPLPPMTPGYRALLDKIIMQVPRDFEPKPQELAMRNDVLHEIESFIRQTYPSAQLKLFGSSCNGFGFGHSDLDICMTLEQETSEGLDCVEIIETLASRLRKHRGLYNVLAITTAKVPIVKFRHRRSQLEGDISLYNTLAQHNTQMLMLYSEADHRVKALGYTMKVFGKLCNICDASRGSLSSYAYIIMVLYFLQQRKPPIIPVLQEVYKGEKPELIVEGWNAWYYSSLKNLRRDWPDYGKNTETVGELWLGMLRFYTEEFNFRDYVISVRQHKPLTRFEKLWNGKCVAIEDPFDMSHNLGAGVSRKMNMYIMKAFRNGRKVFGTPVEQTPMGYNSLSDYLFDPQLLTEGEPPNDRGCRACGKIGHFAKECPIVVARKERNERERERRKEEREQVDDDPGRNRSQRQDLDNRNDNRHDNRSDNRHDNRRQRDQDNRQHNQHKGSYQGSSPRPIPSGRSYGGGHHASPHADLTHSPYSGHGYGTSPYGSSPRMQQGSGGANMGPQVFYNSTISGAMRDGAGHMGSPYGGRPQDFHGDVSAEAFTWQQKQFLGSSPSGRPGATPVYGYGTGSKAGPGQQQQQYMGAGPQFQPPQPYQQEWTEQWVIQQQHQLHQQQQYNPPHQYQTHPQRGTHHSQQQQQQQHYPHQGQQQQHQQQLNWQQQKQAQQLSQGVGGGGGRWGPGHSGGGGGGGGGGGSPWDVHTGAPVGYGEHRIVTSADSRTLEVSIPNEHYQRGYASEQKPQQQEKYYRPQQQSARGRHGNQQDHHHPHHQQQQQQSQQHHPTLAPSVQRLFSR